MVLQNKYKARASRRYNAARGGLQDGRGRGRGRGGYRGNNEDSFPSLNPDEDGKDSDEEEGEDETNEAESPGEVKGKYSRRKLESNAWRYQEEEVDPHQEGEEEEPELEVDLSGLLERVAKLDSSRTSRALSSKQAAETSLQAESEDIDHSLLYLLDRQRERERGKAGMIDGEANSLSLTKSKVKGEKLSASELELLESEGKRLLEERERERRHYGRAQMLLKHQQQPHSKVISLNIGENRREKEDNTKVQSLGKPKKIQSNFNMASLYDDETDEKRHCNGEIDKDGFDTFFNEVSKVKNLAQESKQKTVEQNSNEVRQAAAIRTSELSAKSRKEDEDFLDGII